MSSTTMSVSFPISLAAAETVVTRRPFLPSPMPFARLLWTPSVIRVDHLRLRPARCSPTDAPEMSDFGSTPAVERGSERKEASSPEKSTNEILNKLKRYGISGILSYGLLNTVYYLPTFLVVWFYIAPAPARMGYLAAAERFLKVMAMVWAGSQVTKLMRAGGALALAPFVDTGLSCFTAKFGFESQGKAFMAVAGICFGLAFLMFFTVTILSA